MKVLIVGNGGREHAIAWKLAQSPNRPEIYVTPGNAGSSQVAKNVPLQGNTPSAMMQFAAEQEIDLVVIGPEAPLVSGLADQFRAKGIAVIGPSAAAAELEGSKVFAKQFFARHHIPTAAFHSAHSIEEALDALTRFSLPVVIKADGLAAGKGVIIAQSHQEARAAILDLMARQTLGAAGSRVVLEEFLCGEEVSFIVLTDGERILAFPPAQDHKAILDEDRGPNTGGMGAYCDARILTPQQHQTILREIIHPTLGGLRAEGRPFQGFLFAGLMITDNGPKILEFNVRLGDPETQALLHSMRGDFLALLKSCAAGNLDANAVYWDAEPSVCVVLAAANYPGNPRTGDAISGIEQAEECGAVVFHAGTQSRDGKVVTSGGRVLGVTASAPSLPEAIERVYEAASHIQFDGMQKRSDIGAKGRKRWEAESTDNPAATPRRRTATS
ncbi:MAG: phosphoribosylamine--glycine ligase [Bryobacterales bacterium]|nr:phosphoribosylamine--glycine ligase [Bryobacterales bacterium]